MSDIRNYEEYRAQVLDSLGEDYTVEDLRNFERWRLKVLEGLSEIADPEAIAEAVDAWLDDHPEATTTIEDGAVTTAKLADGAVTTAKLASDGIKAEVAGLKTDLGEIRTKITYKSSNLLNLNDPDFATGKYVDPDHGWLNTNASYNTSGFIPVEEGQVLHFGYDTTPTTYRTISFICPYDATKTAIQNSGASNVSSYTVPSGAKYVRFTASSYYMQASQKPILYAGSITKYEEYFPPYTVTKIKNNAVDVAKIPFGHMYRFDLGSDETFTGAIDTQAIQGFTVVFRGNITGTFTGLLFGRGVWTTYGFGIEITANNVNIYTDTNSSPTYTYAHGLTIKDYIGVTFNFKNFRPSVKVETNGGTFTHTDIAIDPKKGVLSAISDDTVFTDCTLSYFCQYYEKRNYLYGDSYFAIDLTRWTRYLYDDGIKCMLNAYPGRNSATALQQVKQDIAYGGCPKRVVWCLGMNDGDNGAINSSWKECVDWLIANHEYYGFELILATIPNTPEVDNSYKNAYVEASGFRYIDFASAVGAHDDTTWYDNMLSSDNVHPLTQGAIALYSQAIADLPELFSDQG